MSLLFSRILYQSEFSYYLTFRLFVNWIRRQFQVLYDTGEFLEKNRDPLHSEIIQLFSLCNSQLPQLFASTINPSQKQGVITKFKVHQVDFFIFQAQPVFCDNIYVSKFESFRNQKRSALYRHETQSSLIDSYSMIAYNWNNACSHVNLLMTVVFFFC